MTLTYIRPDADDTDGTWTNESDNQTNLFASIDETVASDADYIKSVHLPDHDICKIRLSDPSGMVMRPATVHYRFKKRGETTQQINLDVSLLQGATEIAKWTETDIATSYVDGSQTLTLAQFNSISDFNNLYLQFDASSSWWLAASEVDLWFEDNLYHLSTALSSAHLLLHFDGADASTTFIDATGRHQVKIQGGSPEIDTAQSKFGGASLLLSGGNYLTVADPTFDLSFGTGDFTVDCWVRFSALAADMRIYTADVTNDWTVYYQQSVSKITLYSGTTSFMITGTTTIVTNTWYHIAVTRSGTSTRLFINGAQEGSTYSDSNNWLFDDTSFPQIGNAASTFWLDELRVVRGTAAWTTTFTPPTAPYNVALSGPYAHLSCSRASIGYAKTSSGTLTQFAANALRITDLGLLVEDARTNSALQSQTFSTTWTQDGLTLGTTTTAPDGTSTGQRIIESSGSAEHRIYQSFTGSANTWTYSIFAKADQRNWIAIRDDSSHAANFNVSTGVVGTTNATSSSIEAFGSGWYRCSMVITSAGGTDFITLNMGDADTGTGSSYSYTGNGTSGLYIWGAQAEVGAFSSSYIATTSGSQTRAADAVTCIGNLNTVLSQLPHSEVFDVTTSISTATRTAYLFADGSGNPVEIYSVNNGTVSSVMSGATLATSTFPTNSFSTGVKVGIAVASGARSLVGDGGTVVTDANAAASASGQIALGCQQSVNFMYGYTRRVTIWNSKLADADLDLMTDPAHTINFTTDEAAIDLDFVNAAYNAITLPYDFLSISRASVGYAQTVAGTLQLFGANQLRITDKGLLVEDAGTNLATDSEVFSNWTAQVNGATVTSDTTVAPNGSTTADTLAFAIGDYRYGQVAVTTAVHTFSIYLKGTPGDQVAVRMTDGVPNDYVIIATLTSSWVRWSVTGALTATVAGQYGLDNRGLVGAGFGAATLQAWGGQLEVGAFPSSYIPTTSGSQTRAADDVACIGSLMTVVGSATASLVIDSMHLAAPTTDYLIAPISSDRSPMLAANDTQVRTFTTTDGGAAQLPTTLGNSLTFTIGVKAGTSWSAAGRSLVGGGGTVNTDAVDPTDLSDAHLGVSGAMPFCYFRRLTAWTTKLADVTLQGFTNP